MIKLSKIISEIKIVGGNIIPKIRELMDKLIDSLFDGAGTEEYNPKKFLRWEEIWNILETKHELELPNNPSKIDILNILSKEELNQLYNDLLSLNTIKEIKIISNITPEMVYELMINIRIGMKNKNIFMLGSDLSNLLFKYTGFKMIIGIHILKRELDQKQLNSFYKELQQLNDKY